MKLLFDHQRNTQKIFLFFSGSTYATYESRSTPTGMEKTSRTTLRIIDATYCCMKKLHGGDEHEFNRPHIVGKSSCRVRETLCRGQTIARRGAAVNNRVKKPTNNINPLYVYL